MKGVVPCDLLQELVAGMYPILCVYLKSDFNPGSNLHHLIWSPTC